jgi:hypothetical protein
MPLVVRPRRCTMGIHKTGGYRRPDSRIRKHNEIMSEILLPVILYECLQAFLPVTGCFTSSGTFKSHPV